MENFKIKILNALILSNIVVLGAAPTFADGYAERCVQAMNILTDAQVDPVILDMFLMKNDPMLALADTMFVGDFGPAETF